VLTSLISLDEGIASQMRVKYNILIWKCGTCIFPVPVAVDVCCFKYLKTIPVAMPTSSVVVVAQQ
jgi:hypothetical protein